MNVFDVIDNNFFSLLSSKNKELYSECILRSFQIYEMGPILGIDKKIVVDDLTSYLAEKDLKITKDDISPEDEYEFSDSDVTTYKEYRQTANFVLRRMQQCGWIYTDITSDYIEVLNFNDYAITIIEALLKIEPRHYYYDSFENEFAFDNDQDIDSFKGYIYTIFSLLTNKDIKDYAYIINEVYRNTKQLIRDLRKLDSRLKDYISYVVGQSEIKNLIEKLFSYKEELVDKTYNKLKTSDNINKYKLTIINELETYISSENIMNEIISTYLRKNMTYDKASDKAFKDLNELIDIFNDLDDFITEIDVKNKTYINTTIGKIKFLISEDDNVIGKLNNLMKYIKYSNNNNQIDKAIKKVNLCFTLKQIKTYNCEKSLFVPRGRYTHNCTQTIDDSNINITLGQIGFSKALLSVFDETKISKFLDDIIAENGYFRASQILHYNSSKDDILNAIYCLVFACEKGYNAIKLSQNVENYLYTLPDFVIRKSE